VVTGQPPAPGPPSSSKAPLWIGLAALGVVVVLVVLAFVLLSGGDDSDDRADTDDTTEETEDTEDTDDSTDDTPDESTDTTGPLGTTDIPFAIGDDPVLDELAVDCSEGDMEACDDLYVQSPVDTNYEDFGNTCGDRFPDGAGGSCEEELGEGTTSDTVEPTEIPFALGDDPELDELATGCADGDLGDCDDLYFQAPIDSNYEDFGKTCGTRAPEATGGTCEFELGS
jgi:hypothetical protein